MLNCLERVTRSTMAMHANLQFIAGKSGEILQQDLIKDMHRIQRLLAQERAGASWLPSLVMAILDALLSENEPQTVHKIPWSQEATNGVWAQMSLLVMETDFLLYNQCPKKCLMETRCRSSISLLPRNNLDMMDQTSPNSLNLWL